MICMYKLNNIWLKENVFEFEYYDNWNVSTKINLAIIESKLSKHDNNLGICRLIIYSLCDKTIQSKIQTKLYYVFYFIITIYTLFVQRLCTILLIHPEQKIKINDETMA